nr:reverse transcriptase domain-containing protein [Tanacetum cinerariifolium]
MIKAVDTKCETCGGPHSFTEFPAVGGYTQETAYATTGTGSLPSNTVPNPREDLKAITTRSGVTLAGPLVSPSSLLRSLLNNKEKLFDLAMTSVNENCSEVILKKLLEKLGDPIVDYVVDPRVPLILGRPFLRIGRALIDVYGEELTLHVNDETITFKVGHTLKYSYNDSKSINQIDVIDIACEEYVQEVLGFSDNSKRIDDTDLDLEGDIHLLEELLNNDPSLSPLPLKELNVEEVKTIKSSIDEPPELELKELSSYLEYAYLEGADKLPVIITEDLKDDEKEALLKMEDDFKPMVQSQRRVNSKIHEVIKKEVIKLLDAGMIYPISDSPWVSHIQCVPRKGGITVVENENNELIPTRLVTGLRVCIDYQKLNDATRKDHFSLPFMDQMLKRLAGNEFYCFLDGFSGYFQILIDPQDQEKTTFTCPYGTFSYQRMPFGLCNAPGTFQSGQVEVSNRGLKRILERTVGKNRASWSKKLEDALWDFKTAYKTPIGCTPYKLVYGKSCHSPIELENKAYWALKHANFDLKTAGDHRKLQLNELNELHDQAYENSLIYKEKTTKLYDSKIKNRIFYVGDRVFLFNSHLNMFSRKLKTRWTRPFTIAHVFPYGTIELSQPDGPNFKVNGYRVKHYFERDIPQLVFPDLQTFPMDQ